MITQKLLPPPHRSDKGVITLLSVLIVGIVGLSIGALLMLLSLSESRSAAALQNSLQARGLADACAEHALNKLRISSSYAGNETLSFNNGTCTIQALTGSGSVKTIRTIGVSGDATRKDEIITSSIQPQVQLTSWQEKDF